MRELTNNQRPATLRSLMGGTALSGILACAALPAGAQETSTTPQAPIQIGPVSVEGETPEYKAESESVKSTAPLLDTPRSVTVVTEQVIEDTAATSLAEALRTVPGITMAMGEGGQPFADRPFIRGSESTSGILIDGVRDSGSQTRDVFNLEQIEVSKGASGPLAGRGAAGGSLNLVTIKARAEKAFSGAVNVGNEDQKRVTADVNQPFTDSVAMRVAAMWQDSGIPGRDELYDKRWGVTPTIAFGLDGGTRIDATYTHFETDGIIDYGHPLDPVTGKPVEGLDPDNFYGLINRDFHDTKQDSGQVEINHDLNDFISIRNLSRLAKTSNAYIASNPDDSQGNVANGLVIRNVKSTNSETETFSNQLDLLAGFSTGGFEHSLATGLEYTTEETDRATYSVEQLAPGGVSIPRGGCDLFGAGAPSGYNCTDLFNPNPLDPWTGAISLNAPTTTEADTVGIYIFDTISFSEKFLLNVGARWDSFSTETSSGLSNDDDIFSYQIGGVYKVAPNASIYASVATSASPSGLTVGDGGDNISASNEDLKPEKSRNYEIGAKWETVDGRLALNVAAFRNEVTDAHITVEPGRGGAQEAIGEQRVDGLEVTIVGQLTDRWDVSAGYSHLESEIVEAGPVNPDQEGNKLPNTPQDSFSLWTTYDLFDRFTIGGGANYMSERFGNTANTRSVDEYWRYDAMLSYAFSDNIAFQLNVLNLTDERYYDRVYTTHMATIAPGRSIVGRIRFDY